MKTTETIRCTSCGWQGYSRQRLNHLHRAGRADEELFKKCPKCLKVDLCFDLFEETNN